MKIICAVSLVGLATAAQAGDLFDRHNADRLSENNGGSRSEQHDGVSITVPADVTVTAPTNQRGVNISHDDSSLVRVTGGVVDQSGNFYIRAKGAYFNPRTGRFIPSY